MILDVLGTEERQKAFQAALRKAAVGFPGEGEAMQSGFKLAQAAFQDQGKRLQFDVIEWAKKKGLIDAS